MSGKDAYKKADELMPILKGIAIHFFMLGRNNGLETAEHAKDGYCGNPPEWPDYDKEIVKAIIFDKLLSLQEEEEVKQN